MTKAQLEARLADRGEAVARELFDVRRRQEGLAQAQAELAKRRIELEANAQLLAELVE